jgi:hypothetical protein
LYRKLKKLVTKEYLKLHFVLEVGVVKYVGESDVRASLLYDETNFKMQ